MNNIPPHDLFLNEDSYLNTRVEEIFTVYPVMDMFECHNFVMCFESEEEAKKCFDDKFHMFTMTAPLRIVCRYNKQEPSPSGDTIVGCDTDEGLIEYEVLDDKGSLGMFQSFFVYRAISFNRLTRRSFDSTEEDKTFAIWVDYSKRPAYEPRVWFGSVVEYYFKEIRERYK